MDLGEAAKYGVNKTILQKLEKMGIVRFTTVQGMTLQKGLCNGRSLIIAAPTSTGKTMIAEIAAINGALQGRKTVYLVTFKALAEEKYNYFVENYGSSPDHWFDISIATGDRTEGEWRNGILVATYEKYLGLLSSSESFSLRGKVVIADEIQILSDKTRGADVEILCSILRGSSAEQIIALSATAPNVEEIAEWLNCTSVKVEQRDVPLRQEIWWNGKRYANYHGDDQIIEDEDNKMVTNDTLIAVRNLLTARMGPVLVFTMTRPRAIELAEQFSKSRSQDVEAFKIGEQLDLFAEPTSLSTKLRRASERRVAFHSADLSFAERSVVEKAYREKKLDVVFSTPTLAAGVNFPIKTVVFDAFGRSWDPKNPWISKSEYLNMSGRAGRLGLDKEGFSILMPKNKAEEIKTNEFISFGMDSLHSVLMDRSTRKSVLHLLSIRICKNEAELNDFYRNTFWWSQTEKSNPKLLSRVAPRIAESLEWLFKNGLIEEQENHIVPTSVGRTISATGLLPSSGVHLLSLLKTNEQSFRDTQFELPLIHAVCCCDEFDEDLGQRFLPFSRKNRAESLAENYLSSHALFVKQYSPKFPDKVTNAACALHLWSKGEPETNLRRAIPPITYGQLHLLAMDVGWVLEGIARIAACPAVSFGSPIHGKISLFAQRIKAGVTEEALDILKASEFSNVPGLGRQRAMALARANLSEPNLLLKAGVATLAKIVEGKERASRLMDAVGDYFSIRSKEWSARHLARSTGNPADHNLLATSYNALGTDYEDAMEKIFREIGWKFSKIDSGGRQGVPDFQILEQGRSILIECKTKKSDDAVIDKEAAFDILGKSVDIRADHYVTLGKPDFDSFSKSKAVGSTNMTLVPHYAFVEAFLRWRGGRLNAQDFFSWLVKPGVATIDGLPA